MIQRWQTVKIFISSTFRDMHAERNHLIKVVFPSLRERLERHRIELIDIDLRWGVTAQEADNDRVLEICLEQIDNCRPFFVGILGERYGWVPTALPEIAQQRYGWIQKHTGCSVTELEILHGVLNKADMADNAFFYFRDPRFTKQLDNINRHIFLEIPSEEEIAQFGSARAEFLATERRHKLERLKARIRASSFPIFDFYPVCWDPTCPSPELGTRGRIVELKEFGEAVERDLLQAIAAVHPQVLTPPPEPSSIGSSEWFEEESLNHLRFIEQKLRVHVGRDLVHRQLLSYIDSQDQRVLLLTGVPGSGKSAVFARLCSHLEKTESATMVISHFVGASPASTDLRLSLKRLAGSLDSAFQLNLNLPEETPQLVRALRTALVQAPVDGKLVIIVDGLDHLDENDPEQALMWLPESLPPQVRVLIGRASAKHDGIFARCRRLALSRWSLDERIELVTTIPSLSAKSLDQEQIVLLLDNPATANPLFLTVALEELRGFGSFEGLDNRIRSFPRSPKDDSIILLFEQVLQRLETDLSPLLVREALTVLSAARSGLSETELADILDLKEKERGGLQVLLRQLRNYLLRRGQLLCFAHGSLLEAVKRHYLTNKKESCEVHLRLADYFSRSPSLRRINEQPWQLVYACAWQQLWTLLADLDFLIEASTVDRIQVYQLWTLLESNLELGMVDAYAELINTPAEHDTDTIWVVCKLLDNAGHLDQTLDLWHHLMGRYKDEGDLANLAAAIRGFAMALYRRGVYEGAAVNHAWEERICHELGDPLGAASALQGQGRALQALGDIEGARNCFEKYSQVSEDLGAHAEYATAAGNKGILHLAQGEFDEALRLLKTEETLFRELGDPDGVQRALGNQAVVYLEQKDADRAEPLLVEKQRICREIGDREELAAALGNLGIVAMIRGDHATASTRFKEQEELARMLGNNALLADALSNRASVLNTRHDAGGALELLREQEHLERALERPAALAKALLNQAITLATSTQQLKQALVLIDEALPLFKQAEPRLLDHARHIRAEIDKLHTQRLNKERRKI